MRRLARTAVLTAAALTALSVVAAAQEIPPAPPAAVKPPPPRFNASGEFSFVDTGGNAESTSIGVRGEFIYRPRPWVMRWRGGFVRLETDEALEAQSFVFLFRAERPRSVRVSAFGEYNYLRDLFAGLEHKNVANAGLSYAVADTARQKLILDGSVGLSREIRVLGDDLTAAVLLGGVGYLVKVSSTTELTEDVRYEQSLDHDEDWRLDNTLALVTKINSVFSLKVSHVVRYAHAPVEGFQSTDTITSVALVAKF
jgi:putative salt-induced outer membrane protein YdiY